MPENAHPPMRRLPRHYYATFGSMYRDEAHPTLPGHIADPAKVIEIWAPDRETARRLIVGLTMHGQPDALIAAFSDLHDWPTTLSGEATMAEYYPGGVSMIIDCRET